MFLRRYYLRLCYLGMLLAMLHAALPTLHMLAASQEKQRLVLCSGLGSMVVLVSPDQPGHIPQGEHAGVQTLPCAVGANACGLQAPVVAFAHVPPQGWRTPQVANQSAGHYPRFAYAFRRGRAPPLV